MNPSPRLGIIAGGGNAARELIAASRGMGHDPFVIALEGQADPDLICDVWLGLGSFGALKKICAQEKVSRIVMLGRVRRPSIVELKPDLLGIKVLAKIGLNSNGDDGLLRAVGKAIEAECAVRVVGAHEVFSGLLTPEGVLTNASPDEQAMKDIARGMEIAKTLGSLDVGQAVVVQQGLALGVEAVEGTDALIARAGQVKRRGGGGVLIKCAKPQQDFRFDLPSFGPSTIDNLALAGLSGIAVEASRSLLLEREKTVNAANEKGIFIIGLTEGRK